MLNEEQNTFRRNENKLIELDSVIDESDKIIIKNIDSIINNNNTIQELLVILNNSISGPTSTGTPGGNVVKLRIH